MSIPDILLGLVTIVTTIFLIYFIIKKYDFIYIFYTSFIASTILFCIRFFMMDFTAGRAFLKSFNPIIVLIIIIAIVILTQDFVKRRQ
ncbi:hypothetical protein ERX37_02730 [Macrococcus hajekii]|uniref:Uncharacterized protein n=1 Tax=Macrococcus hajekii TaxID=198482 RepID=A0A4R6BMW9_9STAP|nr:hypothetical protein [Macrococcus hajekii]TDM03017.1 hypothetical protein ERX37_02730 [Macrococcus hajekii]GGB05886.1 hypothetical protein GCM10007190_12380 [Macrococcus hajekii]